ncbi:hypothetical protein Q7C36_019523 [Tachysurus vachellii]|uniref:Uncharacterized protein n=1 Tax=Tachysurus vachellii TaxID=175792 RepID=A0AA88LWL1_TACVA|nr:hypothetical protein Q7C36_019523 [Tachysurus vachellii]
MPRKTPNGQEVGAGAIFAPGSRLFRKDARAPGALLRSCSPPALLSGAARGDAAECAAVQVRIFTKPLFPAPLEGSSARAKCAQRVEKREGKSETKETGRYGTDVSSPKLVFSTLISSYIARQARV